MFEIQEDHVRKILSVVLTECINALMTNVSKLVKTIVAAHMDMDMACGHKLIV